MRSTLTMLALLLALPASAQTIWRCGVDGRSFSDKPCADGTAIVAAAAPTPAAVAQARAVAAHERQALARLATERRQRDAEAVAAAAGIAQPRKHPARKPRAQLGFKPWPAAAAGT